MELRARESAAARMGRADASSGCSRQSHSTIPLDVGDEQLLSTMRFLSNGCRWGPHLLAVLLWERPNRGWSWGGGWGACFNPNQGNLKDSNTEKNLFLFWKSISVPMTAIPGYYFGSRKPDGPGEGLRGGGVKRVSDFPQEVLGVIQSREAWSWYFF